MKGNEKTEVVGKRTQTSKTFNNSDGTYTTEIYEAPIHFKDSKGNWKDIDNDLQKEIMAKDNLKIKPIPLL